MNSSYQINLNITSPHDIATLKGEGFFLCALQAVEASSQGRPVVWWSTNVYGASNSISWTGTYGVFDGATTPLGDQGNANLVVEELMPTSLDQAWQIASGQSGKGGFIQNQPSPGAGMVEILNDPQDAPAPWTVGLAQGYPGGQDDLRPTCAFDLLPNFALVVEPVEKILLYFDTALVAPGTVVSRALQNGLIVDLSGSAGAPVTAVYSVDDGWGGNTGARFTQVPASQVPAALVQVSAAARAKATR